MNLLRLAQFWEGTALKQMCVFWKEAFWWQKKTFSHPLWPVTINKQHLMDFICSLNLVSRTLKRFVIEVTAPHRDITEGFSFLTLQLNFCIIYCKVISTANVLSSEWLQCECIELQWRLNLSVNITHSTVWTRLALVSAENGWGLYKGHLVGQSIDKDPFTGQFDHLEELLWHKLLQI